MPLNLLINKKDFSILRTNGIEFQLDIVFNYFA